MSCAVIKEVVDSVHCEFYGFLLFSSNNAECHKYGDINSLGSIVCFLQPVGLVFSCPRFGSLAAVPCFLVGLGYRLSWGDPF